MIRKHFFLREDQIRFLENLNGSTSEHVRIALDNYMDSFTPKATTSPSVNNCSDCGAKNDEPHKEWCTKDL